MGVVDVHPIVPQHHGIGITDKAPVGPAKVLIIITLIQMAEESLIFFIHKEFLIKSFGPTFAAQDIAAMDGKNMKKLIMGQFRHRRKGPIICVPSETGFPNKLFNTDAF